MRWLPSLAPPQISADVEHCRDLQRLMAIPNLIALFLLSGKVVELTKEYFSGEGKTR